MSDDQLFDWRQAEKDMAGEIDWTVPHSARVWDYWLGGKDYYEVDQETGDEFLAGFAGITDAVRQLRYFTARAVETFYPEVAVTFTIPEPPDGTDAGVTGHSHVPLLLSPFAYSTYRGS